MFKNAGNLRIALIVLYFGEKSLPVAIVLFIIENVLRFTVGLHILDGKTKPLYILKMPLIIATTAALTISSLNLTVPNIITTPIDMMGQIPIPIMLFSLGMRMTQVDFSNWKIG